MLEAFLEILSGALGIFLGVTLGIAGLYLTTYTIGFVLIHFIF